MTSARPEPRSVLQKIAPYVGGRERIDGVEDAIKLSANENPLGASPAALARLAAFDKLAIYPDGAAADLRNALARKNSLDPARIICGNGSDEILHLLAQAYLSPGTEAIMTQYAFLVYHIVTSVAGARSVIIPEPKLIADVDAILGAVTDKTRMVFLANPNNPTGTMLNRDEISRLHAGLRSDILLVLDGAYAEYVPYELYPHGYDLVEAHENVVTTRTFSKIYGLAALRVGWAYCPPAIADILNRIRPPFNVNAMALLAAEAAVHDDDHVVRSVAHNTHWRDWLTQKISGLGYEVVPSMANFILIRFGNAQRAAKADEFLGQRGLIVRAMAGYGLADSLRLTVGPEDANRRVVAALQDFKDTQ